MSLIFATIPSKRLAQGITSSSSSFYVNNIIGFNTTDSLDVDDTDLGTQHYVVFRNDTGTKIEIMEIDPTTISTGPITIVRRGLSYYGDRTTEVTANKLDWSANETIVNFGTDAPQMFQYLKEYIDAASIAGAVPASTTAAGIVIRATQAEVDARTATDGSYDLFARTDTLRATKYHDYIADAGSNDTYAITVVPAITAYSAGQEFTFKANTANTGACTLNVSGLGAKTIKKNVSTDLATGDILANQIVTVVYDGTNMQLKSSISGTVYARFGGTGADGDLSISSGTTTLDLGGAKFFIKNYSSISITSTGKLTFSNPHASGTIIIIKSQGNVTITSTQPGIDASGMGGAGGTAGTGAGGAGGAGTNGTGILDSAAHAGNGGDGTPTVGLRMTTNAEFYTKEEFQLKRKSIFIYAGSGGGGGAGSTDSAGIDGGAGGRGGGGLQIECGGALNFTGSVSVAGLIGAAGENNTAGQGGGGGGGGSTGSCVILYNTLTSAAGTITATGGAGGVGGSNTSGGSASGSRGYGGDGAGSFTAAGGAGGDADAAGSAGAGAGAGSGGGGGSINDTGVTIAGGAATASEGGLVAANTEFY